MVPKSKVLQDGQTKLRSDYSLGVVDIFIIIVSFSQGNNPMNIPTGGITTDQQPPNLISESALPTSLGAAK